MRHRVGQLDSVKSVPYEELEAMRSETEARLKVLEEAYWGKRDSKALGASLRDKYKVGPAGSAGVADAAETPAPTASTKLETRASGTGILKKTPQPGSKKSFGVGESLAKPKFGLDREGPGAGASRSRSRQARGESRSVKARDSPSPDFTGDPRQQIYEAKYEKYLANKKAKRDHEQKRHSLQKEDFDLYTKALGSPSKSAKRTRGRPDPTEAHLSGKYNPEDLMAPANLG